MVGILITETLRFVRKQHQKKKFSPIIVSMTPTPRHREVKTNKIEIKALEPEEIDCTAGSFAHVIAGILMDQRGSGEGIEPFKPDLVSALLMRNHGAPGRLRQGHSVCPYCHRSITVLDVTTLQHHNTFHLQCSKK